jgi:protein associated with RNAse G/E
MNQKKISVHAYKFNSKLYRSYEFPTIIEENDDFICIDATFSKVIFLKENKNVYSKINRATL